MGKIRKELLKEYSDRFDELRQNWVKVSFYKLCIKKYLETGNTEYLCDFENILNSGENKMLKEITFDEVKKLWDSGEIGRVLYLYDDGSDAYIDYDAPWADVEDHWNRGVKFAIEIEDVEADKNEK